MKDIFAALVLYDTRYCIPGTRYKLRVLFLYIGWVGCVTPPPSRGCATAPAFREQLFFNCFEI